MSLSELELGSAGSSARIETVRVSTGSIAAGAAADVVVAWPTAFPDADYTATVEVEEGNSGNTLQVRKIVSRVAASMTVRVANNEAIQARTGTLHAIAVVG